MEIYLIRHGQSTADLDGTHEGQKDNLLTDLGRKQAKDLSRKLKKARIDAIYASPLRRAKKTARIINREHRLDITFLDELMEKNNGVLAGLPKATSKDLVPMPEGGWNFHEACEGAESEIDMRYRVERVWSYILKDAKEKGYSSIMIVSHGGVLSRILQVLCGLPIGACGFIHGDCGVSLVELKDDKVLFRYINQCIK